MKINITKLYESFIDIKKVANIDIIFCYKQLFNRNGIKNNIAFYITVPMIIFHIISIFIFYKNQKKKIDTLIKNISFAINNWKLVTNKEKEKMQKGIKIFPNIKKNKINLSVE